MSALVTTQGFSEASTQLQQAEVAAVAVAARAKAQVEARYIMAMRNPRNWDQARQDILKECNRSSFAEDKSVWYKKPVGAGVEGLGIRFVEMALRCIKNIHTETPMLFEDSGKEVYEVTVTDLEANVTYSSQVIVSKTVDRAKPLDDGTFLSVRKNSSGKSTYTVPARDDELLDKRGALMSKAIRALGLKHIPGDIKSEAESAIKQTRLNSVKQDPDLHRKRIVDAFAKIGVKAIALVEYLGHPLDQCSPAQVEELREIYSTIIDGEADWKQFVDKKNEEEGKNQSNSDPLTQGAQTKKTETVDKKTGIITENEPEQNFSFAQVKDFMIKAKTVDDIENASGLIDSVKDKSLHVELNLFKNQRLKEIAG